MNDVYPKPWLAYPEIWKSESVFFSYIRGCLRKAWVRHPVKLSKLKKAKMQIPNPNPKGNKPTVFGCKCDVCGGLFAMKDVEVDHITPAGGLSCVEDIQGFTMRLLFVTEDDLRIVCKKTCHPAITLSERRGISFREALIEKRAIQIMKDKQEKEFLRQAGVIPASNQKRRKEQVIEVLKKE